MVDVMVRGWSGQSVDKQTGGMRNPPAEGTRPKGQGEEGATEAWWVVWGRRNRSRRVEDPATALRLQRGTAVTPRPQPCTIGANQVLEKARSLMMQ